jgi:hypothetical protein
MKSLSGEDKNSTVPTRSFSTCVRLMLRCCARIFSYSGSTLRPSVTTKPDSPY